MATDSLTVHQLDIALHRWGEVGSRTPVVCLASTGLSAQQWRRLGKQLAARGHLVLGPDLVGYGESARWPGHEPFRTEIDVAVAEAALALCEDRVHLVGHSYGGRVALLAGLRRPERVRSLSLFEPTCFGVLRSRGDALALRELETYDPSGKFLDDQFGGSEAWVERFVDYWSGVGTWAQLGDDERQRWLQSRRKMFEEVRETVLDDVPHTRYAEAFAELPALLLSGAESTLAGRRCAELLGAALPRGRHREIAGVGHMGPLFAGREIAALIAEHIAAAEDQT